MVELKAFLDHNGWDIFRHEYFEGRGPNGDGTFPPEMEMLVSVLKRLEEMGIVVKGMNEGIIDFPSINNDGEEMYLCWKLGEDDIAYWHHIGEGFESRKQI
jgi:hypothetical protein